MSRDKLGCLLRHLIRGAKNRQSPVSHLSVATPAEAPSSAVSLLLSGHVETTLKIVALSLASAKYIASKLAHLRSLILPRTRTNASSTPLWISCSLVFRGAMRRKSSTRLLLWHCLPWQNAARLPLRSSVHSTGTYHTTRISRRASHLTRCAPMISESHGWSVTSPAPPCGNGSLPIERTKKQHWNPDCLPTPATRARSVARTYRCARPSFPHRAGLRWDPAARCKCSAAIHDTERYFGTRAIIDQSGSELEYKA